MASTVWKGYLTFGLISVPIRLFSAARSERISLNQLHKVCHSRIRQPLYCPTCERMVERSEIEKGYEYEKNQYVLFEENELDKIEPASAESMEILEFVKLGEVDPLYFDASYYVTPEDAGKKAYSLLVTAMEESGYGAVAKLTMHQRENIVIIRPRGRGLTLHTMFYANEIREVAEYGQADTTAEVKEQEKKLALQLIETLAASFQPEKYRDEYQEGLRSIIAAKLKGQEVTPAAHPHLAPVIDLMAALKTSLEGQGQRAAQKSPPAAPKPAAMAAPKKARKKAG